MVEKPRAPEKRPSAGGPVPPRHDPERVDRRRPGPGVVLLSLGLLLARMHL